MKQQVTRTTVREFNDLIPVYVPMEARFHQDKGGATGRFVFHLPIAGASFVEVRVWPALPEMQGTAVNAMLSIKDECFQNGHVRRLICFEPVPAAEQADRADRWFDVVPNRPDEIAFEDGDAFYHIPHPTVRGATLRGAIVIFAPGGRVTLKPVVVSELVAQTEVPAESAEIPATEPVSAGKAEGHSSAPVADVDQPAPEPEPVEAVPEAVEVDPQAAEPAPKPEPVRMGEVPRKPRSSAQRKPKPAAKADRPATRKPAHKLASPESIAALAAMFPGAR